MFNVILFLTVLAILWAGNRHSRLFVVAVACLALMLVGVISIRININKQVASMALGDRVTSSSVSPSPSPTPPIDREREEFVSSVRRFVPLYSKGEASSSMVGYQKIFRHYAEDFYDIPTQMGLDPKYVLSFACWVTGYGSSEDAFMYNDIFGVGHPFASVPDAIRAFCRFSLVEEEEVLELVSEIF